MIIRIPQRRLDDCVICAVAMVMGPPYSYERVAADSDKYPKTSVEGKFPAWWETYLVEEGFDACYCRFNGLYALRNYTGAVVGLLGMDIPHLNRGHVVAVDEVGVVDPADNAPDHVALADYIASRLPDGIVFHDVFLAVRKGTNSAAQAAALLTPCA
ncbi:MAG TPA: hypothetical protein VMF91_07415 [Bryobacteraceae bacterium]|nr:hypothetical protein [Bryobacteraceae bacterium]